MFGQLESKFIHIHTHSYGKDGIIHRDLNLQVRSANHTYCLSPLCFVRVFFWGYYFTQHTRSLQARYGHLYLIGRETEGLRQAPEQFTLQGYSYTTFKLRSACLQSHCFFIYTTQTRAPIKPFWGPVTQAKDFFLFWLLVSTCVKVGNPYPAQLRKLSCLLVVS